MLQFLREKTSGWIAFLVLGVVTVPFLFFGIEDYFQVRVPTYVAKIGKKEISQDAFRIEYERFRQMQRQQMGDRYSAAFFEQPTFKRQKLEQMVNEEVLVQAAQAMGALASPEAMRKEIAQIPAFQTDGKFDPLKYRMMLESQYPPFTVQTFEERVKRQLSASLLPSQVSDSALVTAAEVDEYIKLQDQLRDYQYAILPASAVDSAEPPQSEIEKFYEANKSRYENPERVAIAYIEIKAADLKVPEEADEATLRARYEEQKARYVTPEERLASHILVRVPTNADAKAQKAAQAKAAGLLRKVREGAHFEEVAKAESEDLGSKAQGGDLGWVGKGITQPAFETALFAMKAGDLSEPVKTDEGYHIIYLREVRAEQVKSFEEVRAELANQFKLSERDRLYNELAGKVMDQVSADQVSLEAAAQVAGVSIQQSAPFPRTGGVGVTANPALVQAAFSESMLGGDAISDAIRITPDHMILFKVTEHKPAAPKPLTEVRADILRNMREEAVAKATEEKAKALEQRFLNGESWLTLGKEFPAPVATATGIGRSALNQNPAIVAEAFKLPRPAGKPSRGMVKLGDGTYAFIEVSKAQDGDPSKAAAGSRDGIRLRLEQGNAMAESQALIEALREEMDVRIVEERL